MTGLWSPVDVGRLKLPHRLAMAPMTRNRAARDGTPTPSDARYYAQRASLGLLIAGGTQPSGDGQGFLNTHGIYTAAHIAGWRRVTDAVHHAGGHLFIQVVHAGRIAHPYNTPHHRQPVAPSAVAAAGVSIHTPAGRQPVPTPRALSTAEIRATIAAFRQAAAAAVTAGADGVEIHGGNGFLVQQFLSASSNHRTDAYGASVPNRVRFAVEVAAAVATEIGADRTGIRLSPGLRGFGIDASATGPATYRRLVAELAELDLAFIHLTDTGDEYLLQHIRAAWPNALLLTRPGRGSDQLGADIDSGLADVIAVGRLALANPDLVDRLRHGAPLNRPQPDSYYGGGECGYTDYPTLDDEHRGIAS